MVSTAQIGIQFAEDEEVAMRMCFSGFCADFRSHLKLSDKAEVEANSIAANRFNRVFEVGSEMKGAQLGVEVVRLESGFVGEGRCVIVAVGTIVEGGRGS
ncbi:hypothetical protein V6N13_051909 [Hibiscus sabdariffa]